MKQKQKIEETGKTIELKTAITLGKLTDLTG